MSPVQGLASPSTRFGNQLERFEDFYVSAWDDPTRGLGFELNNVSPAFYPTHSEIFDAIVAKGQGDSVVLAKNSGKEEPITDETDLTQLRAFLNALQVGVWLKRMQLLLSQMPQVGVGNPEQVKAQVNAALETAAGNVRYHMEGKMQTARNALQALEEAYRKLYRAQTESVGV